MADFGPGSGTILLDDVRCTGDEDSILECRHSAWGSHNCNHTSDVGVTCRKLKMKKNDVIIYKICNLRNDMKYTIKYKSRLYHGKFGENVIGNWFTCKFQKWRNLGVRKSKRSFFGMICSMETTL